MSQGLSEINIVSFTAMQVIQHFFRYFIFSGVAYGLFWVIKKEKNERLRIQKSKVSLKQIQTEIRHSIVTILIFGINAGLWVYGAKLGLFKINTDFSAPGSVGKIILSLVSLVIVHDTYFYWLHRFLHLPGVFERFHLVHHQSYNPTPWAVYSFHPVEAVLESLYVPFFSLFFTVHVGGLIGFVLYTTTFNVIGHLGYELYGVNFKRFKLFSFMTSSTHHNLHHHYSRSNYGFYFRIWDRLMKTEDGKYELVWEALQTAPTPIMTTAQHDPELTDLTVVRP